VAIGLHRNDVATYIVAWGVPGVIATGVGLWFLKTLPRFRGVVGHQRATGPLSRRYASEFLSGAGALQAIHFAIAGVFGVAAIGALRAAQTLLGPFNQLLTGLNVGLMPEMVRLRKERPQRLRIVVASVSVAGAGAVMLGTLLLAAMPESLGSELLGDTWPNARRLILPAGLAIAGNMFIVGPLLGLRALGAATSSLTARLICSVLTVVSSLGVLAAGGSLGAVVWSIGISVWLGALIWWFVFLRVHERAENAPPPAIAGELATREVK
jgi:O-antigen/teichoic acid export membrane protein